MFSLCSSFASSSSSSSSNYQPGGTILRRTVSMALGYLYGRFHFKLSVDRMEMAENGPSFLPGTGLKVESNLEELSLVAVPTEGREASFDATNRADSSCRGF